MKNMERTLVKETVEKVGKKVKLAGWVNTKRDHGKVTFIDLRDRSGIVQVVGSGGKISSLKPEYVVEIQGTVRKREKKLVNAALATGTVEVKVERIKILAKVAELPLDMGKSTLDVNLPVLLDNRPLTLRHPKIKAIFKVQETIIKSFREALKKKDFTEFEAPTIVPVATEGGAEIFPVAYYDYTTYLGQSPQLYKQIMVSIFERAYTVGRAYRAEPSVTTRHLTEYISLDCEFGFIDSWLELMDMAECVIREIFDAVAKNNKKELEMYSASIPKLSKKIPRLKMREAQKIIYERTGRDNRKEPDLEPEDEREICRWSLEEHGSDLIFITHYPTNKRPFYTYPDPEDPEYTYSFDLLGRGLEWVTGGQRINDYEQILGNIKKWKLSPNDFSIYLQAFKYGMPPEGGFALGAERITMQILGLKNIREASLFPRDMERVDIRLSSLKKSTDSQKKLGKGRDTVYKKLVDLLEVEGIKYTHYEHEPVYTSKQAAKARGDTKLHQGAKALVLQADKKLILFVLPADLQADLDALKKYLNVGKLRMASKESVKSKIGLEVGSIPPLGSVVGLDTYVDKRLSENDEIAFNAGCHDRSIKMRFSDFTKVEKPEIVKL